MRYRRLWRADSLGWIKREFLRVDNDRLRAVQRLVDANQAICEFEHRVTKRNDHKLGAFSSILKKIMDTKFLTDKYC